MQISTTKIRLLLASITILLAAGSVSAATYLSEGKVFRDDGSIESAERIKAVKRYVEERQDKNGLISVGDMRFKAASVLTYAGFSGNQWTDAKVYYTFDANVTAANRAQFIQAAKDWEAVSGLTFIARNEEPNYIYVRDGSAMNEGNFSFVGMTGGRQELVVSQWFYEVTAHEIGHALGLIHEQSRPDRDDFVVVLPQNFDGQPDTPAQFAIEPGVTTIGAYDFLSIMHYAKNFFSGNGGDTLRPLPQFIQFLDQIGAQTQLSVLDKAGMGTRYPGATPPPAPKPVITPIVPLILD